MNFTHKKLITCILFVFILSCCQNKYNSPLYVFPETVNLTSQEKTTEGIYMKYPFRIRLHDSSLYVMDLHTSDYYYHRFDYPSMVYRQSFAKRGEAPEEFLDAENIRIDKHSIVWVLDANRKKITGFDKDKSIDPKNQVKLAEGLIRTLDFDIFNDSTFIVPDYTGVNRLIFINSQGEIIKKYFHIPISDTHNNTPSNVLAQAWRSFIDYNPNNGILAMATQLGQVIDIYDLKNNIIVNVVYGKDGEPQFIERGGYAIPMGIMGYSDIHVGNTSIYALFWGNQIRDLTNEKEGGRYIHVFDLKGNPIREYTLDRYITAFHIDEKNKKIIALDINSDQPIIEYLYP